MISIKQIRYALAVEETRHFKKASELCAVSQSALSTAISEMETQLGVQLFERDNKKVLVTPIGEQILEKAKQIKMEIEDLELLAKSQKAPLSYPMKVGIIPTIGPYLLPRVMPKVRSEFPEFKMEIVEEQSHVLVDMVKTGKLDTAILALPYDLDGLLSFEFWKEDFYLVTHKDQAPNTRAFVTTEEIDAEHLLLLKDGHCLKDHALSACSLPNNVVDNSMSGTGLYTLVQMVASKMGSTLVPQMALEQLVADSSELVSKHLEEPGPHRRIAFISRPNYSGVGNIEILMKLFKQILTDCKTCS